MRTPRIHTAQRLTANSRLELEAGPSQHLARSLRMGPGAALVLFDGSGGEYPATIVEAGRRCVVVETGGHRPVETESPLAVHLGIAVSRGERMDWIVQKATELGVSTISPLTSERTEVRLQGERAVKKQRHWREVAISACEQCGRNRVPGIQPLSSLADWIDSVSAERKFVLHHRAGPPGRAQGDPSSVALLVGPEGGLSAAEIDSAGRCQFAALQLGPRVMRTETAPLAAIAILQSRWGDMGLGSPA
ncbi:MAG: 16S rRNA (uracil(1498)-N(3))-methyltransferase [Halioglobus sp.]|jgi:16S rRNA (uracil1498-N3)-methyltransferase